MNILFISPNSPLESIGGVERYITNLIEYFKSQHQFKAVVVLPTAKESFREESGIVTVYNENCLSLSRNTYDTHKEVLLKAQLFSKVVEKIITKHKIDIICAENFHLGVPAAYSIILNMVAALHKVPLVLRLHSFAVTELQIELINQLMWSHISSVSKSVAGDCFHKGADINLLSTNYLGVNVRYFNRYSTTKQSLRKDLQLPDEAKIILTATRIILGKKNILAQKGVINLIQAFSKLSPRFTSWRLLIAIGKPPDSLQAEFDYAYDMLLGYIKLHGIAEKTIIRLFKLNEMPEVYRSSDLFVLASENETFGQVFIESMACGLPVIGTKVGGIPEIISDSYNGYLIPPNDSSHLAQSVEKLINDHSTRDRFIKNGIKTVEDNFTFEQQFSNFIKMLEELALTKKAV
ncbi:glycosyltransferase family 4 protein [Candidatus Daviesbacteria bacterium]|nr:glycosyltransferase family 4 protein [Candidatus Daviesbacteria bacterium]